MAPKRKAEDGGGPAGKRAKGGGRKVDSKVPTPNLKVIEDFTITLNQTAIDTNNNKYYIIQALEKPGGGEFYCYTRWGRVGEDGQLKMQPTATKEKAIKEFESKFREKTKNAWAARASFKPAKGKYTIVETDESGGGGSGSGGGDAPMGKLSEAQIEKGKKVLNDLKKALKNPAKLTELSSQFYTLIPHVFGRKRPPTINTKAMIEQEEELLKFYLRMGFDKIETKSGLGPISGVMTMPVPKSLKDACAGTGCSAGEVKESESTGKDLAGRQAGKPKRKMEAAHYGAIHLYTSNAIYAQINKTLRDENRTKVKKYMKYLRLFFDAADCLPAQKKKLWRGISIDVEKNPQYAVGQTVTWWSISSCTSSKGVADSFAGGCGGGCTVFTINSKTAFDVDSLSAFQGEKESILCPGTKLKVKSRTKKGGITQVELEEVGRAID